MAARGRAYLVYLRDGEVEINLTDARGKFDAEWICPRSGETASRQKVDGGTKVSFDAPLDGSALIYLTARN